MWFLRIVWLYFHILMKKIKCLLNHFFWRTLYLFSSIHPSNNQLKTFYPEKYFWNYKKIRSRYRQICFADPPFIKPLCTLHYVKEWHHTSAPLFICVTYQGWHWWASQVSWWPPANHQPPSQVSVTTLTSNPPPTFRQTGILGSHSPEFCPHTSLVSP